MKAISPMTNTMGKAKLYIKMAIPLKAPSKKDLFMVQKSKTNLDICLKIWVYNKYILKSI